MATYGKKLLDANGNVILPKTRSVLVYMTNEGDGPTVEDAIKKLKDKDTELSELVPNLYVDTSKSASEIKTTLNNLNHGIYSVSCTGDGINSGFPTETVYGIILVGYPGMFDGATTIDDAVIRQYLFMSDGQIWYRTKNPTEGSQYDGWRDITARQFINGIEVPTNWNDLKFTGMNLAAYNSGQWDSCVGKPSGASGYGVLMTLTIPGWSDYRAQLYFSSTKLYFRTKSGGSWNKWNVVTSTSQ